MKSHTVFVTGATGYLGGRLVSRLTARAHQVKALIRPGSENRAPADCEIVLGDALVEESFAARVAPCDTFVQLVGVPHPSPAKAQQFKRIDLVSGKASVNAAARAPVDHFVYVSVAQPAPIMKVYQRVRAEVEAFIRAKGLRATVVRPWYILGPGHRWPLCLLPVYWICERLPLTREGARRTGLVTIDQMLNALVWAVENPPPQTRIIEVPEIRTLRPV